MTDHTDTTTDTEPVSFGFEHYALGFIDALRKTGLSVPVGRTLTYLDAIAALGVEDGEQIYWAGRATLLDCPEDTPLYDAVYRYWWLYDSRALRDNAVEVETVTIAVDEEDDEADEGPDTNDSVDDEGEIQEVRFSAAEVLSSKDFAECSDAEMAEVYALMSRLRLAGPFREARRSRRTNRHVRPDIRRTVQLALRSEGEPIRRAFVEHGDRPRRVVFLLDVSGSMEAYARVLVRFIHGAVVGRQRVEAFALGTRLTRLTRELSSRDPDAALSRAGEAVADWSGGTRLGEGLRIFNDEWGQRGMARGAVVVILSDGWDRGEPELMDEQMGRLHRVAHSVVWVNPLKASPGYAPLAAGMAAALPHVDTFIEGHSVDSLANLAEVVVGV